MELGFGSVFAGPLVRSSYRAEEQRLAAEGGSRVVAYSGECDKGVRPFRRITAVSAVAPRLSGAGMRRKGLTPLSHSPSNATTGAIKSGAWLRGRT